METALLVVNDLFRSMEKHDGIVLIDNLEKAISDAEFDKDKAILHLGQALSDEDVDRLASILKRHGLDHKIASSEFTALDKKIAHKCLKENVLIGPISKEPETGAYKSALIVHAKNDIISDHVTGEHLSGMVLVEAARQLTMAVADEILRGRGERMYYLLHDIHAIYDTFVHPFETSMELVVSEMEEKGIRCYFDTTIGFFQGGKLCTTVRLTYTAYPQSVASKIEEKSVRGALKETVSRAGNSDDDEKVATLSSSV